MVGENNTWSCRPRRSSFIIQIVTSRTDPVLILDLNKVFHVRSVTQGDVIRADAKEIPRILQILYAGEGMEIYLYLFYFKSAF